MPERVTAALSSYDIFGKSIPGIALLFGVIPLFPKGFDSQIVIGPSFINFVAIVFVVFLFGFVMGQAVHTFADIFERIVAWFAWRLIGVKRTFKRVRLWILNKWPVASVRRKDHNWRSEERGTDETNDDNPKNLPVPSDDVESEPVADRPEDRTYAGELGLNDPRQIKPWLEQRGWGIYDALASHRHLFKRNLQWYFDPYLRNRWPEAKEKMVFELFIKKIEEDDEFNVDITPDGNLDDIDELYPILTSQITRDSEGRAMEFQARYSFCRSMWVVFLLLDSLYALVLFSSIEWLTNTLGYLPLLREHIVKSFASWIVIGVFLSIVFVFLFGSGIYKRHFIEYLLADFYTTPVNTGKDE
jgi:hypothetical protein